MTDEHERACQYIQEARALRTKYFGGASTKAQSELLKVSNVTFQFGSDGVVELYQGSDASINLCQVPNLDVFFRDYNRLVEMVSDGAMRSFCFQRLQLLTSSYKMHITANGPVEMQEQSNLLGSDFYRTMKVRLLCIMLWHFSSLYY